MPLLSALAAPGSPRCFSPHIARCFPQWPRLAPLIPLEKLRYRTTCLSPAQHHHGGPTVVHQERRRVYDSGHQRPANVHICKRNCSARHHLPENASDNFATTVGAGEAALDPVPEVVEEVTAFPSRFRPQLSRRKRKAQRHSQPALILQSIQNEARELYSNHIVRKADLAYASPRRTKPGGIRQRRPQSCPEHAEAATEDGPITLYTITARHLASVTAAPWADSKLTLSNHEAQVLHEEGYTHEDVQQWTICLLSNSSIAAAATFNAGQQFPPLFTVLLFLRRRRMRIHALGIVLRHVSKRVQKEHISWSSLKILVIRLLRHARILWPESIPYIASIYSTQAARIYNDAKEPQNFETQLPSDLTRFSNTMLSLLALPTSTRPMVSSHQQEGAQFEVLQFMNNCRPTLPISRFGFRAVSQNQLAHSKTTQEREWAELKGPSWPPWKESRTAMDEEKGYEFGLSRASRVLHGMYEAGYEGDVWEEVAEMYAGWDTDLSPTIQTRTSSSRLQRNMNREFNSGPLLWAGRIRTTRTRREAWACFLAHEVSGDAVSSEEYFAMFEKLHSPEVSRQHHEAPRKSSGQEKQPTERFLPGDMKEPMADPKSPLHLVYLSEPVPTFLQLYHRMITRAVRPSDRLVAFLVETLPDFSAVLRLLNAPPGFEEGWKLLLEGSYSTELKKLPMPNNLLGSFIRFLCRWGRFSQIPFVTPIAVSKDDHLLRFRSDQTYLLQYAFTLLVQFRPAYRPAWTAYMEKVLFSPFNRSASGHREKKDAGFQFKIMCDIVERMDEIDMDPDDDQLRLLCITSRYASQAAFRGELVEEDARHIVTTAPRLLRTVFHALAGASIEPNLPGSGNVPIPVKPHIPDPSLLHAYVRALGTLGDYEGLYSFSTWATTHHKEVTARANAQHSASQALYRTFVCLRAALEGTLEPGQEGAPQDLVQLVRAQIEHVENWKWPADEHVDLYVKKGLRRSTPGLTERN